MRVVSDVLLGDQMRTIIARDTAFQVTLRNCSKEVGAKVSMYVILVKGECIHSSTYFLQKIAALHHEAMKDFSVFLNTRRCMNWAHEIFS